MNRILHAALLGGLVHFGWGALSHTVLPLGHMGLTPLPAEVLSALSAQPQNATFVHPDHDAPQSDAMPASGPVAFLAWQPDVPYAMGKNMAIETVSNVLAALVAALLLCGSACGGTLLCRATTVMGMGVFAWLSISASQWNWYGFSTGLFVGEGLDQVIGWFLSGLVIAAIVKPKAA